MLANILRIAKMEFKDDIYYKLNVILESLNAIIEIVVYIFIWMAVYGKENMINDMSRAQMSIYYILSISLSLIVIWGINETIGSSIKKGQINRELLNPISYFQYYFGIKIGETVYLALIGIITFAFCSIFFGVVLPSSLFYFTCFALLIILNCVLLFFIDIMIGMCAFYTNMIWGMSVFRKAIITIFSGIIAPINMFPELFQKISKVLPFQEFIYTPINIYMGMVSIEEIVISFIKQLIWMVILYVVAKKFYEKAITNVTINGG